MDVPYSSFHWFPSFLTSVHCDGQVRQGLWLSACGNGKHDLRNLHITRTDSTHGDFRSLVTLLDQELRIRDGEEHGFYAAFNRIDSLSHVVVAYLGTVPVGCGAVKKYSDGVAEIKRMFVPIACRGQGIAGVVLAELERWAVELGFTACILETGKKQPEAIRLYTKRGYKLIPNYGQYQGVENSVCMRKALSKE